MIPDGWQFCPRCGTRFEPREHDGAIRPVCPGCGWVYFADPKVVAGVLVSRERGGEPEVLLGRRRWNPGMGRWYLPSGYVDYGEAAQAAAVREVREETGLEVAAVGLLGVWDFELGLGTKRGIAIFYQGEILGGTLAPADDVVELGWFSPNVLPDVAFDTHRAIIAHWQNKR
jgi:8-oxo-dGTP diphosphatase